MHTGLYPFQNFFFYYMTSFFMAAPYSMCLLLTFSLLIQILEVFTF